LCKDHSAFANGDATTVCNNLRRSAVFDRTRLASKTPVRPRLEELESRNLLSASAALAPPQANLATLTATPNLTAEPMSTSGSYIYYTPAEVRSGYGINQAVLPNGQQATGAGQTIAIVDAYHDPNIQADLASFDAAYGLAAPPSFRQVQLGGVTQVSTGWSSETALDVEWAHAVAPQANLLLVEAPSANYSDLLSAVRWAAAQPGVVAVSMSWGGSEFYNETAYDSTFTTPAGHGGVTFVASAGDSGAWYGAQWPAVSPDVLAVGGTSLYLTAQSTYSSESAWSGSGGGYSYYEAEPAFQQNVQRTGRRTNPDVAYDANPSTGFVVRNSVGLTAGETGWWISGGTSAGAPQWAGIIALADQARGVYGLGPLSNGQAAIYNLPGADFHDITGGSNGYAAHAGYDLVTGRGTPVVNRIVADLAAAANPSVRGGTVLAAPATASANRHDEGGTLTTPPAQDNAALGTNSAAPTSADPRLGAFTTEAKPAAAAEAFNASLVAALQTAPEQAAVEPHGDSSGPGVVVSDQLFNSLGVTCRTGLAADGVTQDVARLLALGQDETTENADEAESAFVLWPVS
jgi:subtilase family serine protease